MGHDEDLGYRSVFRPDLFADWVVVVTGGGSGLGRCIAHELASLGASVVLWGRRRDPLEATAREIADDGGEVSWVSGDIRAPEDVERCVAQIHDRHGGVDGLVNNAGGQYSAPAAEITANGFDAVVRTNLLGGFLVAKEIRRASMAERGGCIVNITAQTTQGIPLMSHSSAARAGMANLTKTLAVEWASDGIRVNAVAPGFVASSGYDTYGDEPFGGLLTRLPALTLARRHGTEAELSAAVAFLLSPAAAYITGQELIVAGGSDLVNGLLPIEAHDRMPPFDGFHRSRAPAAIEPP
jgi:citronellol/citronellal dehydrogenase